MKSYRQFCALAKALDVIGDRWVLLIVRELLIGEARYTDLLKGLPGIATNLLAARLAALEQSGIVTREALPAPAATTVFRLTPRGEALRPVIYELGKWAAPLITAPPGPNEKMRARWIALPLEMYLVDAKPRAAPVAIQIDSKDESIVLETRDGRVRARLGSAEKPDLRLSGSAALALSVLLGRTPIADAKTRGLRVSGNLKALDRVRRAA